MRLHAHPVFDETGVRTLGDEAMAATSRFINRSLERHPALIQVLNRNGVEVFRTLAGTTVTLAEPVHVSADTPSPSAPTSKWPLAD